MDILIKRIISSSKEINSLEQNSVMYELLFCSSEEVYVGRIKSTTLDIS